MSLLSVSLKGDRWTNLIDIGTCYNKINVRSMHLAGRLKLGLKRREGGLHRLQKPHSEHPQSETTERQLDHRDSSHLNHEAVREAELQQVGQKCHAHLLPPTNNSVLGDRIHSNAENLGHLHSLHLKETQELEELRTKNESMQARLNDLSNCNKELQEKREIRDQQDSESMGRQAEMQYKIDKLAAENEGLRKREKDQNDQKEKSELNDSDQSYYEREISRLKTECENWQIELVESNHQLGIQKRDREEKEAAISNKTEELRELRKQMEREKTTAAELRAQCSGKERSFMLALEETQTTNQTLSNNMDELVRRLESEEGLRREREGDVARMQMQMDVLVARGSDSESKCIQLSKAHQQDLALHSSKQAEAE